MDAVVFFAVGGTVLFFLILITLSTYQKCPRNQAMIVSGALGSRVIVGGGTAVWPGIEQRAYISLAAIPVDVTCKGIRTADGKMVDLEVKIHVAVKPEEQAILAAAQQFSGKSDQEVKSLAQSVALNAVQRAVGEVSLDALTNSRTSVSESISKCSGEALDKLGLSVVLCSIESVSKQRPSLINCGERLTSSQTGAERLDEVVAMIEDLQRRVRALEDQ